MWEEISRAELLCGVRKMKTCAVGGTVCHICLSLCPAGAALLRVSAAPGALRTLGSVLWISYLTMKTKLQEKCLGFSNTGGSWDSESVNPMLQYSN